MNRTFRIVLALVFVVVLLFLFAPKPVVQVSPVPEPLPVPDTPGRLVVDLADGSDETDLAEIDAILGELAPGDVAWTHPLSADEALAEVDVTDLDDAVARLAGNPLVEVAEPEIEMLALGFPNDPMYERQWHLREMGAPVGWADTPRGKGVIVAVVDTGVAKVEDLEGTRVLEGATFVPGTSVATDDNGHGTHVAGTIAQTTNNGKGVAGVAPEATILPVKVLSSWGAGSSSWIAAGIDYAVDEGAQVINLSLGGGYSLVIHNSIRKAREKGVIVVAAAGNSGTKGVHYPGALLETIGVSATGPGGGLAPYSSWGKGVDIAAPGGDKTKPGGGVLQDTIDKKGGHLYAEFQGTSMATPHVAGAAAVLLSTGMCDADCTERILLQSADGSGVWDEKFGHGRLDLGSAVSRLVDRHGGTRFALALLLGLLIAQLASTGPRLRVLGSAVGALVAGGLFFLHWIPLVPDTLIVRLLGTGLLAWPGLLIGPSWTSFPLWCSALVPAAVTFTLGAFRSTRPLAVGVAVGIGTHLFHGAATGTLSPWLLPGVLGSAWLGVNGAVCLLFALGMTGAEKLEEGGAR